MAFAWLNLLRGAFTQTIPYLERLSTIFSASDAQNLDPSLQGEWLALQSKLLSVQGKPAESRDLSNQALQILPERDILMRSMVYINLATAYEQMLDYDHAAETYQMIAQNARLVGDYTFETLGLSGQARMELVQGHLRQTFDIASEGIRRLEESGRKTPFSATFYGELSEIHYQWHQLDLFRSFSLRSVQASGKSGYSDPEIYHNILLSKMFQMEGDWDAAASEMQKAIDLAGMSPPAMIRENVIAQQIRIYLAFDRFAEAQEILQAEGFTFGETVEFPVLDSGANLTHPVGLLSNSALRTLYFLTVEKQDQVNLKRGLDLAERVLADELLCRHIPTAIETLLIRSQMYTALGDEKRSLADVIQALELGEPEGFISAFVEEGKPIHAALMALVKLRQLGPLLVDYARKVLVAFPKSMPDRGIPGKALAPNLKAIRKDGASEESLVEPLTARELEVLQLIAAGELEPGDCCKAGHHCQRGKEAQQQYLWQAERQQPYPGGSACSPAQITCCGWIILSLLSLERKFSKFEVFVVALPPQTPQI